MSKRFVISVVIAMSVIGCQDSRVADLEKRVDRLEQTIHQLEADKAKAAEDETARAVELQSCVAEADAAYERDLISNGTKQRDGSYSVPVAVISEMHRARQGKIDECKLLYSK